MLLMLATGRACLCALNGKPLAQRSTDGQFYWVHTDHLGSGRKLTDASGAVIYRAEFDPHGQVLLEWAAAGNTNLNTKKFATYERDAGTGLDYAGARMYQGTRGRFMQSDPLGAAGADLKRPQSLNRYAYSENDPVNKFDPSGLLTLIVGGTGAGNPGWGQPGTSFWQAVRDTFDEYPEVFVWDGSLFGRAAAARRLLEFTQRYEFAEDEKFNIVAHSHGGNVAKLYTNLAGARKIDTLVTMGTPQRETYQVSMNNVSTYLNVYSKHDEIQKIGGLGVTAWTGVGGGVAAASFTVGFPWAIPVGLAIGFGAISSWGRTDRCAINIGVDQAFGIGNVGHGDLHSPQVWSEMLGWLGRARLSIHQPGVNGSLNRDGGCRNIPTNYDPGNGGNGNGMIME